MKIRIISFGKIKDASVGELIDYYTKLTERYVTVEQISLKDTSSELITYDQIKDQIDGFTVILTENGKDYTSRGFSTFLYKKFVDFG
ncbi:23S rRNA (pseudouridine(1915)-N(3))-methyltransferase RlmH, partial [Candidatus Dojkabacteria bacterium]|nr:23S rRNA (pseudouridine(1915)-N(3))-methyltransferase RlmH [Candidatus Dojkabacteria bacterium]